MKLKLLIFFMLLWIPLNGLRATESTPSSTPSPIPDSNETRERMMVWSRQLGVTCVYCHNLDNFKDNGKPSFKTSLKHSQMVKILQEEVFHERDKGNTLKVKVDCYMCHRGQDLPQYKEPPNQLTK